MGFYEFYGFLIDVAREIAALGEITGLGLLGV